MDAFLAALRATWDTVWAGADRIMNPGVFVASVIIAVVMAFLFDKTTNTILNYIIIVFLGAAAYFTLTSIDSIGRSSIGTSVALLVSVLIMIVRIGVVWRQAGGIGKTFTFFATAGLILAIVSIVGSVAPSVPVAGQVGAAITRTGDFVNKLSLSVQNGARVVR